ncbi:hypothetical protein DV735_g4149, partial [Chaetothyriales sp. CBS 134920]
MSYHTAATFYPGGEDSYYMPEIVQPAPHRAGEHPMDMAQNVQSMEQAARGRDVRESPLLNGSSQPSPQFWRQSPSPHRLTPPQIAASAPPVQQQYYQQPQQPEQQPEPYQQPQYSTGLAEQPNFSPFPAIHNPTPNIPPTDEQKEATLEAARAAVLSCNDPDVQLTWARDALAYVETAQQNESRLAQVHGPRPRTPRIEHVLRQDALKIVNFLADQHHPVAEFMRGMWLEFGKFGERIDKREAFYCYQRASERRYARADYRIGMQFESSNDALKAIKYYQKGVDAGDSAANYRLGMMTLLGQHGQQQDFERGARMIEYSAATADENAPQGAYVYGMLQAGELPQIKVPEEFVPRNIAVAKINIEKAAYLGFAKAQLRMGSAYELGELGCPFDPALSLHYYNLAARQGESEAEMGISKWFLCGQEGVFEKNETLAFEYAQRAALDGLETAQFAMGYFYEVGIHVKPDFSKAKEWYRQASDNGNPDASARISAISRAKTLSRRDHEQVALQKIRRQHGHPDHAGSPLPPMPEVPSSTLDMPDPSRLSLSSTPSKPYSAAPYPETSLPVAASIPEFRPNSAFGINPNLRSSSTNPAANRPNPYGPPPVQHRASYGFDPRLDPKLRSASVSSYVPQGRPAPPPKTMSPSLLQGPQQGKPTLPPQPRVDIGFSAPQDPTGADRQHRPQDPFQNRPPRSASIPAPGPSSTPRPSATNNLGRPVVAATPPQLAQQGQRVGPGRQEQIIPAKLTPSNPPANAPASSQRPTEAPNAVQPSEAKKPGTGPKTFEEMGIPRTKEKRDCIVM